MGNISILDCTLRDGGYVNSWRFGKDNIRSIVENIEQSGIEIIECGFLKDQDYDVESSVYPNEVEMSKSFVKKPGVMYVGMVALGDIDPDKIAQRTSDGIDGIRLSFHKNDVNEELRQASILISKGYEVFIQPVGTTSYSDSELIELVKKVNEIQPFAFYIVDTLGVMYPEDIQHTYSIVNHSLDGNIKIGFHSHNNLQLSFANAQLFISEGLKRKGDLIVDSSIVGMGRGAGNLASELITQYLNNTYGRMYNPIPLLTVSDQYLSVIYMRTPWGYSTPYYLSAINNCHPNYSNYFLTKKTLNIEDIAKILNLIPDESKELFDKQLAESLYLNYQNSYIDDSKALEDIRQMIGGRDVIVLASGDTVKTHKELINRWIHNHDAVVVHINTIKPGYPEDILFISNSKKAKSGFVNTSKTSVICTSNINSYYKDDASIVDYSSLLGNGPELDNAGLMFLNLLIRVGITKVSVSGFDGFSYDQEDYVDFVSTSYMKRNPEKRNEDISRELGLIAQSVSIEFLTPSLYHIEGCRRCQDY